MGSGISFVGKSQKYSVQKLAIFEDKGEPKWTWADVHLLTTASLVPYHLASDWHGLNCGSGCNLHDSSWSQQLVPEVNEMKSKTPCVKICTH